MSGKLVFPKQGVPLIQGGYFTIANGAIVPPSPER